MTATNQKAVWQNMASKLKAMGGVSVVQIGEPRDKVAQNTMVAIIPEEGSVDETVLNAPREIHTVSLIRYENWLQEPPENIEFALDSWRAEICEDIYGDFDLGGTIAYILPAATKWSYGVVTINNTLYRTLSVSISYRVDPSATFVA